MCVIQTEEIIPAAEIHRGLVPGMEYASFKRLLLKMASKGEIEIIDLQRRHYVQLPDPAVLA